MRRNGVVLLGVPALLAAAACTQVGPDYETPETQAGPMEAWNGRLDGAISAADLDPKLLARWWTTLDDPPLTSLIERAAESNLDLRTADARLRQARAERNIALAAGGPTLGIGGSASRAGTSENAGSGDRSNLFSAGLDARWEQDVFGGLARGVEAAEADLRAAEEARRDVLVTVLAEVALNYAELRTLQRRRGIAADDVGAQREVLDLVEAREQAGDASRIDVDRARSDLAATTARLPTFDQGIRQATNRLAILIGRNPGAIDGEVGDVRPLPVPDVTVAVGVPAQVLRRRPDVRRSERELAAETARVGVAVAELYPKFTLSGTIGLESLTLSSLFEQASGMFGIGRAVQWNVFDGGRTRQQIEVRSAVQEQALVRYERSVLTALEDVQNAITAFTQEQLRRRSLEQAADAATNAARLAEARYEAGETDFLDVLTARRARLLTQDELAVSEGLIVGNLIRLYKALGGGWDPDAPGDADADASR